MGMDVMGKKPVSETGEYFRASVWGWHPLWDLIEDKFSEQASKVENAHYNSGGGLNGKDSKILSSKIIDAIKTGKMQEWIDEDNAYKDALPRRACHCCDGAGIRTDEVGVKAGQPSRELDPNVAEKVGRKRGWCNGCNGLGDDQHREAYYRLDLELMQEFGEFLYDCGGFNIY